MKKRSLFFGGLLLLTMTFGTTSCTIGGDDKKDEIVVNPLDKTQYYIVGTVSDANGGLDEKYRLATTTRLRPKTEDNTR